MFFGSHFTHPNFVQKDRLTVGVNPIAFWQAQLAKPSDSFPEKVLYALQLTVGDLLSVELQQMLTALPVAQGEF